MTEAGNGEVSNMLKIENVVMTTRIRLARNVKDCPYPNRLADREQARAIVRLVAAELNEVESFRLYYMDVLPDEQISFLRERNLISRDLFEHRRISAVLVSSDESISVMLHEEDHIREQYFMRGLNLKKAYERIAGLDDLISEIIPFSYDETLGYLTACPTNLGTGLRASVMLFLPAIARRDRMRRIAPELARLGLTVRGAFGEGSDNEGDLFQISNEVTLGLSEEEILSLVERAVMTVVEMELMERTRMKEEGGSALTDTVLRSYGILTNCMRIDSREFMLRMSDVKLGVSLGMFEGSMEDLDNLIIAMRPANLNRLNGAPLSAENRDVYRAEYAGRVLRGMKLIDDGRRNALFSGR